MTVQGISTRFDPYAMFNTQPLSGSTTDTLAKAFQSNAQKQITKKQQAIAADSQVQINQAKREMAKWEPLTNDITNAQNAINSALYELQSMDQTLVGMLDTLKAPADGKWATQASRFDSMLAAINSMANSSDPTNLLGTLQRGNTYQPNQVSYQASPDRSNQVTVYGQYAGSDSKITLADGTFWMPSSFQTIQRYTLYPAGAVGYPQNTGGGATTLDSQTGNSVTFTTGRLVNAPQTQTGTLQRTGLGLLQSWMYGGLSTTAGRANAQKDIENARAILANITGQMKSALTRVDADLANVQQNIDDQAKKMTQLSTDANKQVKDYVTKAQKQAQTQLNALANAQFSSPTQLLNIGGRAGRLFSLLV